MLMLPPVLVKIIPEIPALVLEFPPSERILLDESRFVPGKRRYCVE
jgi:hypothetical protein